MGGPWGRTRAREHVLARGPRRAVGALRPPKEPLVRQRRSDQLHLDACFMFQASELRVYHHPWRTARAARGCLRRAASTTHVTGKAAASSA